MLTAVTGLLDGWMKKQWNWERRRVPEHLLADWSYLLIYLSYELSSVLIFIFTLLESR